MKNLFLFLFSISVFISCNKENNDPENPLKEELTLSKIAENAPNKAAWVPRDQMKSRNGDSMGYGVILNPNSKKISTFS